jgi:AcrR family transcriptional regulator
MMAKNENMTISELSRVTGIPASTIRFYLREGLIPQPLRKGKTRAYYSKEHVIQLRKLKKLRVKNKLSIEEIKHAHGVFASTTGENGSDQSSISDRKADIITAAIELFRTNGFENTSINDIAVRASISKGTLYKHFSDKEDLFFECADRVFYNIDNDFKEVLNERNIMNRFKLRAALFIKTHSHMIDMLNLARGTYATIASRKRQKLKQIINNLIVPIKNDLDEGVKQGLFKEMDTNTVAHMLMGASEYGVYYLQGKSEKEIEQFIEDSIKFIFGGVNLRSIDRP